MAKIKLNAGGGYQLIPEGTYIFKITEVDDSKYDDFGKLQIKMATKDGQSHSEQFSFIKSNGELNQGAQKAFSFFAKTALNNFNLDDCEIDTNDLKGCYIKADIKHEEFESTAEKTKGQMMKKARMNNWSIAKGFENDAAPKEEEPTEKSKEDIDDFLDD